MSATPDVNLTTAESKVPTFSDAVLLEPPAHPPAVALAA
jgi:hypothetical protein